ncbi:MAG TPA: hypothetical protein DDY18_08990 [Flavobacterium sp.]|jgi:hypothetical protein|nr:hypothetical protein [Flavobacterium sp.]
MDNKTVANTIWTQMKEIDRNLCMCMGVQALTVIEQGLQFKVNGLSFKGYVQIVLTPADLYEVKFLKAKRTQNQALKQIGIKSFDTTLEVVSLTGGIYVEDLMPLLESFVENREKAG